MNNCIFCKIINKEVPAYIVDENDEVIVFVAPENHPLIVTKKHIPDIYSLDEKSASAVMIEAVKIANAVKKGLQCEGVNLVQSNEPSAGQDVFHFHLHIKPRWHDDKVTLYWESEVKSHDVRQTTLESIKNALDYK